MSEVKISEAAVEAASASMEATKNSLEMTPLDRIRLMLTAALPHLHPQPAELAFDVEAMLTACVPGGSIIDPQVVADNIRSWAAERKPAELAEQQGVDYAELVLSRYVKICIEEIPDDCYPPERSRELRVEAMRRALAATGKQQVGEVQGDARAQFEAWADNNAIGTDRLSDGDYLSDDAYHAWLGWQAALAARQPGAGKYDQSAEDRFEQFVQAEIARSPDALRELGEYLGRVLDEDEFPQANSLLLQLATEYATPPAQGIDLGQFRPAIELLVQKAKDGVTGCRMYWGPTNPDATEKAAQNLAEANRLLALIDQREAAPGVGNG